MLLRPLKPEAYGKLEYIFIWDYYGNDRNQGSKLTVESSIFSEFFMNSEGEMVKTLFLLRFFQFFLHVMEETGIGLTIRSKGRYLLSNKNYNVRYVLK